MFFMKNVTSTSDSKFISVAQWNGKNTQMRKDYEK